MPIAAREERECSVDDYGILNEILVRLFRDIMEIEQKAIITPEYQDITGNDMHVIEAIGTGEPKNMLSLIHISEPTRPY